MGVLGQACLLTALGLAIYGAGASLYGATPGRERWVVSGRRALYALFAVTLLAFVLLEIAFLTLGLQLPGRRRPVLADDALVLPDRRGVGDAGGLAAALAAAALRRLEPRRALACAARLRDVTPYATAVLLGLGAFFAGAARLHGLAVRARRRRPAGRPRAQPAAAPPERAQPPDLPLRRLHAVRGPVRVRDRRADRAPRRRRVDPRDALLHARRLAAARHRHPARRALVLRRARLGRLLGLGPGRERLAAAVADRHRVPALGDDPGAPRDAEGLERVADPRRPACSASSARSSCARGSSTRSTPSCRRATRSPGRSRR